MRGKTCFLFDVDGTLVDTTSLIAQALSETISQLTSEVVEAQKLLPRAKESPREILQEHGVTTLNAYWRNYVRLLPLARLFFTNTSEVLDKIAESGANLGVVTHLPRAKAKRLLDQVELADHFRVIQGWTRGVRPKPHPSLIERALAQLGAAPKDAVYVGDTESDMLAAASAGATSVLAGWSAEHMSSGTVPDIEINHIQEILECI